MSGTPSADPTSSLAVDVRRFPWIARLAADYAYDFSSLARFFAGDPARPPAWVDAIRRTQAHPHPSAEMARIIAAQQQRRGASARARDAAALLADARTVAVLTGQQAGLFGGPLFTLLKALTAIKLAEQVARDHGVPAVPVFWIDAEDHDWDEVRACTVLDAELSPRSVSLPERGSTDSLTVASTLLDESATAALDELETILPTTEFRSALLAQLRDCYVPGRGMADAFGRWLEQVLGPRGLVVYDASDPAAKPLVAGVFSREVSTARTAPLASAAGADLSALGYHAQVRPQDATLAVFQLEHGVRRPIHHEAGSCGIGEERVPTAILAAKASAEPEAFSPNVLLRPIVQDTLFPTICYVAGPSEMAYWAQLGGVYRQFALPMPLVYPRSSATLLDSAAFRFLTRYALPLEALQAQDEAALNHLLASQIPPAVEEAFAEAGRAIERQMDLLIHAVPAVDPTLEGAATSTLTRMRNDLQTLRGKVIQAAKRKDETLRRQFTRARAQAFPGGHPQERSIGCVSFLNQYGPALIDRLDEELRLDLGRHWVVHV